MSSTSLMKIARAAQDVDFQARVQAASVVVGIPYHPNLVMEVAAKVDLSQGPDYVDDDDIIAILQPPVEMGNPEEPVIDPLPEG